MKDIAIIGAGGHSKVIIDLINLLEEYNIIGIYDDIKGIKPLYKFFVQLFTFFLLARLDNSLISSFYGLFNIYGETLYT